MKSSYLGFTKINLLIMDSLFEFFTNLFNANGFMPRWVCGQWTTAHGWIYIIANIAIWAAYFTIPVLLHFFISKRKPLIFKHIIVWFILFILFCGSTHLIDAVIFWFPMYRFNAVVLSATAVVSWVTVFVLYKYLPRALEYKSPEQLQFIIDEQTKELAMAYDKLSDSEKQFKALVNNNPDIITRISKDLKYQFMNDSILKVRNIKIEDIIGKHVEEVSKSDNSKSTNIFISSIKKAFETTQTQQYEFTSHTNTLSQGYFSMTVVPMKDEKSLKIEDVITVTKDITLQKLNEIELVQNVANLKMLAIKLEKERRILEDFTYIVSHNLRSPVANLASLLALFQDENNADIRTLLIQKVFVAFEKLSTTVADLTHVVQIRQNTEVEKEMLRFEDVLKDHLTNLEMQILQAGAEIEYDFSQCEAILYPKIYLESVVLNLLTNAIKYRAPERKLHIVFWTEIDKDGIFSLLCQDNGLGIDLKRHGNKIFGLNKTFHEHPDSKGVGLFITKNQVETMGGSISVDSQVDKGTKFTIHFNNHNDRWKAK